jgi:hypothetical protein
MPRSRRNMVAARAACTAVTQYTHRWIVTLATKDLAAGSTCVRECPNECQAAHRHVHVEVRERPYWHGAQVTVDRTVDIQPALFALDHACHCVIVFERDAR